MNILIVGGCGFLGSNLAEKFHKEGHTIHIIDDRPDAEKTKFTFKTHIMQCSANDEKCKAFFELYNFDVVVYAVCASDGAYQQNFSGLVNILELSYKYKLKKIIVLTDIPDSMMVKCHNEYKFFCQQQEVYCKNWADEFQLPVTLIKLANIYGPKMTISNYQSVIPKLFKSSSFAEGKQPAEDLLKYRPQNYIYVNDMAEAVNKAILVDKLPFILTLENVTKVTAVALQKMVTAIVKGDKYTQGADDFIPADKDAATSCENILNWQPRYSLPEGLRMTWKWYQSLQQSSPPQKIIANTKKVLTGFLPYIENIILFAITAFISIRIDTSNNFESMAGLDCSQIYILIMGLVYNKKQSIIAAFLSMLLFLVQLRLNGVDPISVFYDMTYTVHLIAYLSMAVITGYITDNHNFQLQSLTDKLHRINDKQKFLKKSYDETLRLKNKFYKQIINSRDSIGWLYNSINKLYSIESEKIYSAAIDVITELMETDNAVIAVVNKTTTGNDVFLRLKIKKGKKVAALPVSVKVSEHEYLDKVVNKKETFVNKLFIKGAPDMAVPVIVGDKVIAVIGIYDVPFEYFSLHYEKMMRIISMMMAEALHRAQQYEKDTHDKNYVAGTDILKEKAFKQIEEILKQRGTDSYCKFKVDEVEGIALNNLRTIGQMAPYLQNAARAQDHIGITGENVYILLEELPLAMIDTIQKRFLRKNIKLSLAEN